MLDGIYQSTIIISFILYAYKAPTSRTDGWDVALYEFSTTMVFSAVLSANLFSGLNTNVWIDWVFFAVFIGIALLWVYTAVYSAIAPGWFAAPVFGNDHYLFAPAYFWLCLPLTVCLALAPRYLSKVWKFGYAPDDIDIMRYSKTDPTRDMHTNDRLKELQRPVYVLGTAWFAQKETVDALDILWRVGETRADFAFFVSLLFTV